jgi:hypothetical protein
MKKIIVFTALAVSLLYSTSHVEILGLRVYGNGDEYRPPIIDKSEVVTIEFEVTTVHPPNVQIIFKHASKDWVADENVFVNDPSKMMTDYLAYVAAPNGVYHYTYAYKNSFPNKRNRVVFAFAGNYLFYVVDHDENDQVLAEGKFIVTETLVSTSMMIANKFHSEYPNPLNQVNVITVNVSAPEQYDSNDPYSLYHQDIKTVDIIQNWRLTQPYRIDLDDSDAETFVDDFMKPNKKFWIRNVSPGNEYRRLDLSNTTTYPNHQLARLVEGPDLSRFQWQGKPDANGASKWKPFTGANADYLEVELRLRLAEKPSRKIYAVGGFNNWEVLPEYEMILDSATQLYCFRFWVKRGVYDYQYVLGDENKQGRIVNQDWLTLEGNDWRTINHYTALVYYRDRRYGGFDRIVGVMRGRSPGGDEGRITSYPEESIAIPKSK